MDENRIELLDTEDKTDEEKLEEQIAVKLANPKRSVGAELKDLSVRTWWGLPPKHQAIVLAVWIGIGCVYALPLLYLFTRSSRDPMQEKATRGDIAELRKTLEAVLDQVGAARR